MVIKEREACFFLYLGLWGDYIEKTHAYIY